MYTYWMCGKVPHEHQQFSPPTNTVQSIHLFLLDIVSLVSLIPLTPLLFGRVTCKVSERFYLRRLYRKLLTIHFVNLISSPIVTILREISIIKIENFLLQNNYYLHNERSNHHQDSGASRFTFWEGRKGLNNTVVVLRRRNIGEKSGYYL